MSIVINYIDKPRNLAKSATIENENTNKAAPLGAIS